MQYRILGRTGIKVSPYALGALALGTSIGNPDPGDSARVIHQALDAGINLIDTSDAYGESEVTVGQALKGRRDNVVLATKFSRPAGDDPNQQGASRRWIMTAVENSLRRLQTDYIDLYQVHRSDPATDIEETLSALSDLIHSGKVRAVGTSAMPASDIVEAQWVAERRGLERFRADQPPYSILSRGIEREVLPVAQRYGMGILVWGPLGQGMLTGRVRRGQPTNLRRAALFRHLSDERRIDAVERLIPLAEKAGLPLTHLALAFAIAHPGVTSALIGPHTTAQLEDLLASADVTLTDDILDQIDEIVPPGTDVGSLDQAYQPPAVATPGLRRRPVSERAAALWDDRQRSTTGGLMTSPPTSGSATGAPLSALEALHSTPSRRYLAPDPIPEDVLWAILDAAIRGPSGGNAQQWGWVVVTDPEIMRRVAGWYRENWDAAYGQHRDRILAGEGGSELSPRGFLGAEHLAHHLEEAPVWVFPVLRRAADAISPRVGSSIYGAVQQLCLAARAYGIGTSLTTLYGGHEDELRELLGLPPDALTMALIPLGYPARGRWAEPKRRPVEEVVHWNRWGTARARS